MEKQEIRGRLQTNGLGQAEFIPDPQGQWTMIVEKKWAFGIDPYKTRSLFRRIWLFLTGKK